MYVARRARNSVESIANRFRLRETCRGVGRTSVFVFARVYVSTYAIARIHVQMRIRIYLPGTWRNFSIVDTHRRILREFKIPLTTSRHSGIRYKSYIDTYVLVCESYTDMCACTYIYANVFTHVNLTQSLFRYRATAPVSSQSMSVGRPLWKSYEILAKDTVARWGERRRKGQRLEN